MYFLPALLQVMATVARSRHEFNFVQHVQGCYRSGNGQGKLKFLKLRKKSGNFILSQGKLKAGRNILDHFRFQILTVFFFRKPMLEAAASDILYSFGQRKGMSGSFKN